MEVKISNSVFVEVSWKQANAFGHKSPFYIEVQPYSRTDENQNVLSLNNTSLH